MSEAAAVDRAMKTQLLRYREALDSGMPRLGWKMGITDPRMLARLGLEAPVVGWLDGARALRSGETYVVRPGTRIAIEAEVAVRVGGGGAVSAVAPALELVNYSLPANSLEGILEQDIFHDAVVLGRETLPVPVADDAWPHLLRNGQVVAQRDPSVLVLQPARTVRDVAATLARYNERLEKDDWLILGSLVPPVPVHAGDRFEADFGPLGRVAVDVGG